MGSKQPLSSWQGVNIAPSRGVDVLYLANSGLVGPLSSGLSRLSNLTSLDLRNNGLSGSIPSDLGNLTLLTRLYLSSNRLSGLIPFELGQLSNLTDLWLDYNELSGSIPSELGQLTALDSLLLGGNELSGSIPSELGQLTELIHLGLQDNRLSDSIPSELGQLSNLTDLWLDYNELSGSIPSELGRLTDLTHLHLARNNLTGSIPVELGRLTALKELRLSGNELLGHLPSELSRFDPYNRGPMALINNTESHLEFTLSSEVWDVWLCNTPDGDLILDPDDTVALLNREVTPYYRWLSNDRYQPQFRYAGRVKGPHLTGCRTVLREHRAASPQNNRFGIIGDTDGGDGGGGLQGKLGFFEINSLHIPNIIHEIGHALGFPHSYGGLIHLESDRFAGGRTLSMAGDVYEYDNPMDLMSGSLGLNTAMIAVHRYAAGWIDPANVAIHPQGKTYKYELQAPGTGGTQMLILRDTQFGAMITLGARVAKGYDSDIPKEGVEAYKVDQFTRRTQQIPPPELIGVTGENLYDETKAGLTQHVYSVGDVFEVGTASVEILERMGDNFSVRVVDTAEPVFAGRFSDEDGSAHEGNIEAIAARGVTVGCSPTYPGLFCPDRVVTRAQMMAFLARALGEEGDAAATTSRFGDVPASAWYLSYLERLADLGVAEPYEDDTFRPSEPLTRRDMAVFLTRAFAHIPQADEPAGAFEDVPADAPGAAEVEAILAAGVTRGCSAEPMLYCPEESVTRAQMASFLTRALQNAP